MMPLNRRHLAFAALAAPLTLALAACGSDDKAQNTAQTGEAIAKISAPAGKQWADMVTVTDADGYLMGNPDAPLKLIEYASLTCPHCAEFAQEGGAALRDRYVAGGVVSYELRNQIHDGFDLTMAMLVRCGEPRTYHALSEQVWANLDSIVQGIQANGQAVEAAMKETDQGKRYKTIADATGLTDFFASRGISKDRIATCLARPGIAEQIVKRSEDQSKELDVQGTPTFFLNGKQLDAKSWSQLEPLLQQAGAR